MNALPYIRGTVFDESGCTVLLLMCLAVGAATGFLRDIPHGLFSEQNRVAVFFFDLFAVLFSYVSLFTCALNENYGILRWYHIAAAVSGFLLYHIVFSPFVRKFLRVLSRLLCRCLSALLFPVRHLAVKGKILLQRLKQDRLRRRQKAQYVKMKKQWLRLASRGFDCLSS